MRITSLFGLPAHIFLVHIPVILVPLVAAGTVLMLWPTLRARLGGVVLVLAGTALVATVLATESGKALRRYVKTTTLVREHVRLGGSLTKWAVLLAALVAAAVLWDWFTRRTLGASVRDRAGDTAVELAGYRVSTVNVGRIATALAALSVAVAGVSTYEVYRIGHSGSKAVWTAVQHRIDTGQQIGGG